MKFVFFVTENSKANHAFSQGASRKTRKTESPKKKNSPDFVVAAFALRKGVFSRFRDSLFLFLACPG
jgi:hypothetical protein